MTLCSAADGGYCGLAINLFAYSEQAFPNRQNDKFNALEKKRVNDLNLRARQCFQAF
jgi:hypothetical protein